MKIDILTLFPEMFDSLKQSIIGKAVESKKFEINIIDIRSFSKDKHKKCDDYPYGGGAGMVMTPQPLFDAIKSVKRKNSKVIYLSPKGRTFNQSVVLEYSKLKHLVLVCGRYEGIDQRIIDLLVDEELSIGDFVLTGGELAASVVVDAVARYLPGVLGNEESTTNESFSDGLLEYPQYTRPAEFKGKKVPEVLLSGNHGQIEKWRKEQSQIITQTRRKDLLKNEKQ